MLVALTPKKNSMKNQMGNSSKEMKTVNTNQIKLPPMECYHLREMATSTGSPADIVQPREAIGDLENG